MKDKGTCAKCGQKIQRTAFDKCMYCGQTLPAEQRFSAEEKEAISERQEKALEEAKVGMSRSNRSVDSGDSPIIDFGSGID